MYTMPTSCYAAPRMIDLPVPFDRLKVTGSISLGEMNCQWSWLRTGVLSGTFPKQSLSTHRIPLNRHRHGISSASAETKTRLCSLVKRENKRACVTILVSQRWNRTLFIRGHCVTGNQMRCDERCVMSLSTMTNDYIKYLSICQCLCLLGIYK
jgi:hypothetical protein